MSDLPITLVDASGGSSQDKNAELGKFRAQQVQVIESIDPATQRARIHDGFFQPRNFHVSEGDPLDPSMPKILDRRFSLQLIIDRREFGTFKDVADPLSKYSSIKGDWPAKQHSTRIIDGTDPKGNGALLASAFRVIDDHKSSYALALELNRESASAKSDADTIAAGYVYDATNKASGYLDSIIVVNPKDKNATGKDGTTCGIAGIPSDVHIEYVPAQAATTTSGPKGKRPPINQDKHGPIAFDGDTDVSSGYVKGKLYLDKSVTPNQWVPALPSANVGSANIGFFDLEFTCPGSPSYAANAPYVDMGPVPFTGVGLIIGSCQVIESTLTASDGTPDFWQAGIGNVTDAFNDVSYTFLTGADGLVTSPAAAPTRVPLAFPLACAAGAKTVHTSILDFATFNGGPVWSTGVVDGSGTVMSYGASHGYVSVWSKGSGSGCTLLHMNGGTIKMRVFYLAAIQQL